MLHPEPTGVQDNLFIPENFKGIKQAKDLQSTHIILQPWICTVDNTVANDICIKQKTKKRIKKLTGKYTRHI